MSFPLNHVSVLASRVTPQSTSWILVNCSKLVSPWYLIYCFRSSKLCTDRVPFSCGIKPCTSCQIVESRIFCYYVIKHSFLLHVSQAAPCWAQDCQVSAVKCAQGGRPGTLGPQRGQDMSLRCEQRGRSTRPWDAACRQGAPRTMCVCVSVCVCVLVS